jgi:hypothetical protein
MTENYGARAGDLGATNVRPTFANHHTAETRAQATACATCANFYSALRWSHCAWPRVQVLG